MAKRKTPKEKLVEVNVDGKNQKVHKSVKSALEIMSAALRSHEVALLTWVHKVYNKRKHTKKTKIEEQIYDYAIGIPDAENILERMKKIDEIEKNNKKLNKAEEKVNN